MEAYTDVFSTDTSLQSEPLILFQPKTRYIFLTFFIVLTSLSIIVNCGVIYSIIKRKYRIFQKTCIISLAVSDIVGTLAFGIINIQSFSKEAKNWDLPSVLCSLLPTFEYMGVLASSATLTMIAMDRYRNVVFALTKRWDPNLWSCLIGAGVVWSLCFGISYPMFKWYLAVHIDKSTTYCILDPSKRIAIKDYYICTVILVFLPLLFVFIWFNYHVALLVWKHRKPFSTIFSKKRCQENTSSATKSAQDTRNLTVPKSQEDVRVEKKIRTFKIIIVLMVVFITCRLPYFSYQIFKTAASSQFTSTPISWYLYFTFQLLQICSSILNPLLYTFLNKTLKIWSKIMSFVIEICCFCCSRSEFDCFEKENPFLVENSCDTKKKVKVRFERDEKY